MSEMQDDTGDLRKMLQNEIEGDAKEERILLRTTYEVGKGLVNVYATAKDYAALEQENAKLKAELELIHTSDKELMEGECGFDKKFKVHCTCVPGLRRDVAASRAERDALREEVDALRLKVQQCSYLPVWWKSAEELQKELAALRKSSVRVESILAHYGRTLMRIEQSGRYTMPEVTAWVRIGSLLSYIAARLTRREERQ